MEKYNSVIERAKSYQIWSFQQIGMSDPFPNEPMETEFSVPTCNDDLVYRADRYMDGNSPCVIYIPSKLLLFKLMRSCIGVNKIE